ncbi:MFS transporter [Rothia nasimurium]|uniref:MFS transporter n=1 Tax=Rothia nasimurium TaxID=85336 RepID=UPI001F21B2A6|nr:MFS transporter [Rothia nasimurium]
MKWLVWAVAIAAYVFSIINRSSFSALGATAQTHFGVEATAISLFIMLQLVVYASCQVPVGALLDRKGAPVLIACGLTLMTAGQFLLAHSDTVPLALLARVLVGSGDACIFVSLIRLISDWFTPKQIPVVNQISANMGQMGQLVAVTPLVALVAALGWQGGFTVLATIGSCLLLLALFTLRPAPGGATVAQGLGRWARRGRGSASARRPHPHQDEANQARTDHPYPVTDSLPVLPPALGSGFAASIRQVLAYPGVRLAFWVHYVTASMIFSIMLLWGMPFLTGGLGYSRALASGIVSTVVASIVIAGFFTGSILSRFSPYRVHIAVGSSLLNLSLWSLIFFWPGIAPTALVYAAAITLGINGPVSMAAFEVVRSHVPQHQRGLATGIANMGGFVGALTTVFLIGLILDSLGAGTPDTYTLEAFRWAMASHIPVILLGILMIVLLYPKARRELAGRQ